MRRMENSCPNEVVYGPASFALVLSSKVMEVPRRCLPSGPILIVWASLLGLILLGTSPRVPFYGAVLNHTDLSVKLLFGVGERLRLDRSKRFIDQI
jgi:hypothetical protein